MDPTVTPATDQAAFLRALADHLDAHPDLVPVNIVRTARFPSRLQLAGTDAVADLIAWARSLDATTVRAQVFIYEDGPRVHLHALAELGGHRVDAWDAPADVDADLFIDGEDVPLDAPRLVGRAQ